MLVGGRAGVHLPIPSFPFDRFDCSVQYTNHTLRLTHLWPLSTGSHHATGKGARLHQGLASLPWG